MLQAIVLSFAGLQFTSEHLALGTDAEVLHNEIGLSNVRYRNSSLNINLVKEDQYNLPDIHVTSRPLTKFAQKLYACEVLLPLPEFLKKFFVGTIFSIGQSKMIQIKNLRRVAFCIWTS